MLFISDEMFRKYIKIKNTVDIIMERIRTSPYTFDKLGINKLIKNRIKKTIIAGTVLLENGDILNL